jgi:RecB family exonuclease
VTEAEIERYFVQRVKALGGYAYKFRSVSQRGVADRIAVTPRGTIIMVEIKKPGGRLSALQKVFAEEMRSVGAPYVCLWSKQEVDDWCKRFA